MRIYDKAMIECRYRRNRPSVRNRQGAVARLKTFLGRSFHSDIINGMLGQ